jgi:hypothetical protein
MLLWKSIKEALRLSIRESNQTLYHGGLVITAMSLPLSKFGMSVGIIIIGVSWLLRNDWKEKWEILTKRRSLWYLGSLYLLFVIGLLYSSNVEYALHDLRIKLPLLLLPLFVGTSRPLSIQTRQYILSAFILAVSVTSILGALRLFGLYGEPVNDLREISLFISHIRFSLEVNLAIFISLYQLLTGWRSLSTSRMLFFVLNLLWLTVFLYLLKSLTGWVVFGVVAAIFLLREFRSRARRRSKYGIAILGFAMILLPLLIIGYCLQRFYNTGEIDFASLPDATVNGNLYSHYTENRQLENANFIWLYLCEEELSREWPKRSEIEYYGLDARSQEIKYTLIRYLASKGLTKDSLGITQLTEADIKAIESGIANHLYLDKWSLYTRIYVVIWQVDTYVKGGNPSGHSVTQRMEYLRAAGRLIGENLLFGVGTGDVQDAFIKQYEADDSLLSEKWRLRAHNQFATFLVSYGIIGFCWIIFAITRLIGLEKRQIGFLEIVFFLIALLSMLNEDTLETHAGVTFISFFLAYFVYSQQNNR